MPKCILIVDDHEPIRRIIRNFLESEPGFYVCDEAVDGWDAIEKAKILKPDLVILDLSMPRMNGIEAARRLKDLLPQTQSSYSLRIMLRFSLSIRFRQELTRSFPRISACPLSEPAYKIYCNKRTNFKPFCSSSYICPP